MPIATQLELSPRELAYSVTDRAGFTVSEATVYRTLKRHGLHRTITLVGFPAGKEFRVKTTAPNQLWQSGASYYFVVVWGRYYSIEMLDDFSRFVLASDLKHRCSKLTWQREPKRYPGLKSQSSKVQSGY